MLDDFEMWHHRQERDLRASYTDLGLMCPPAGTRPPAPQGVWNGPLVQCGRCQEFHVPHRIMCCTLFELSAPPPLGEPLLPEHASSSAINASGRILEPVRVDVRDAMITGERDPRGPRRILTSKRARTQTPENRAQLLASGEYRTGTERRAERRAVLALQGADREEPLLRERPMPRFLISDRGDHLRHRGHDPNQTGAIPGPQYMDTDATTVPHAHSGHHLRHGSTTRTRTRRGRFPGRTTWTPMRLQFRTPNGTGRLWTLTLGSRAGCLLDGGPALRSTTCSMMLRKWTVAASIGTTSSGSTRATGRACTRIATMSVERGLRPGGTAMVHQRR